MERRVTWTAAAVEEIWWIDWPIDRLGDWYPNVVAYFFARQICRSMTIHKRKERKEICIWPGPLSLFVSTVKAPISVFQKKKITPFIGFPYSNKQLTFLAIVTQSPTKQIGVCYPHVEEKALKPKANPAFRLFDGKSPGPIFHLGFYTPTFGSASYALDFDGVWGLGAKAPENPVVLYLSTAIRQ